MPDIIAKNGHCMPFFFIIGTGIVCHSTHIIEGHVCVSMNLGFIDACGLSLSLGSSSKYEVNRACERASG